MGQLHQLLTVEATLLESTNAVGEETVKIFQSKHHLLKGAVIKLEMFGEGNEAIEEMGTSVQTITTTVKDRLDYTKKYWVNWLDCILQKEITNQTVAKADLIVDGETILKDVPATFLLGLESKLKHLKKMFLSAPTLKPGIDWQLDEAAGKGVYKNPNPEVKVKTAKIHCSKTIAPATKEHREQVETWTEDQPIGKITTLETSGNITPAEKNRYLDNIDALIIAVKIAREKANGAKAATEKIGDKLFSFILDK